LCLAISDLTIRYKPVVPISRFNSPYAGPPSESADQSWHDLLKDINLRVTGEEISKNNQESIALPEGGGYLAWIGAHHQLHCIVSFSSNILLQSGTDTQVENDSKMGVSRTLLSQPHC